MRRTLRNGVLIGASLMAMGQSCSTPSGEQSVTFLRTVIESGALNELGPAGEAVTVLQTLPDASKAALLIYVNRRLQQAAIDDNEADIAWFSANRSCLASGDCAELTRLQRQRARRTGTPFPPGGGEGDGGGGGGH